MSSWTAKGWKSPCAEEFFRRIALAGSAAIPAYDKASGSPMIHRHIARRPCTTPVTYHNVIQPAACQEETLSIVLKEGVIEETVGWLKQHGEEEASMLTWRMRDDEIFEFARLPT